MVKLPMVMGLMLCEQFKVDRTLRRVSLEGLFLALRFPAFPSQPVQMTTYAALFDARGEGELQLVCTRLETEEDLYYNSRWCSFPMPGRITHLTMPIRGVKFAAPGRYRVTLSFDNELIATRYFDVEKA